MAFLHIFVSQQLLFLFSKHLVTLSNVEDCEYGQTNLWYKSKMTPEDGIKLYGLYKQATTGDINANDLEISKIATDKGYNDHTTLVSSDLDQTVIKCAAWEMYHGKNSEECMTSYVSLVNDISFRDNGRKKLKKI